jgi:putative oxidoreductase
MFNLSHLESATVQKTFALFARVSLSTAFLSAVADRLGVLGPFGTPNVSWGDFERYTAYTKVVLPFLDGTPLTVAAIIATLLEFTLGVTVLIGAFTRASALLSGALLLVFALALAVFIGPVKAFAFSVFSAAAAGFLLAALPSSAYVWSLDRVFARGFSRRPGEAS